MSKKILLIFLFSFIFLSSVYGASAKTFYDGNITITVPSRYFVDTSDDSINGNEEMVSNEFIGKYSNHEVQLSYMVVVGDGTEKGTEVTQTELKEFADVLESFDFVNSDGSSSEVTVISSKLTKISGVSAMKVRVKSVDKNASGYVTEVLYADYYYSLADNTGLVLMIGSIGNIDYLNSTEAQNIIASIIIRDTVSNSRPLPFTDIYSSDWYFNAVKYNYENGIILGTTDYRFSPSAKLTRGMIVTILYRMEGAPAVTSVNKFSDVSSSKYYYNAVRWASQNKIVNGYTGTSKFGPEDYVTREQLAVMLTAYCNYKGKYQASTKALTNYSDTGSISSWAKDAMRWAVNNKIINGNSGKLNPKAAATRAEAATMLYSYCSKFR